MLTVVAMAFLARMLRAGGAVAAATFACHLPIDIAHNDTSHYDEDEINYNVLDVHVNKVVGMSLLLQNECSE